MTTFPALFADANSVMIYVLLGGMPIFFVGFIVFVIYFARRVSRKNDKARLAAAPVLAEWDYSAAEWAEFASQYGLSSDPAGPAHVTIKGSAITITDNGGTTLRELSGFRRYVTDCRIENAVFFIRVRAYPITGTAPLDFTYTDISIPVPPLASSAAARAAAVFNAYIAEEPQKDIDTLPNYSLPHDAGTPVAPKVPRESVNTGRLLIWAMYFGIAAFIYFVLVCEVATGDLPSKGSHPNSRPAAADPVFFWIMISIETGFLIYVIGRGIYTRMQLRAKGDIFKNTGFIEQRTAGMLLAIGLALESLIGFMLPLGELVKGNSFGGYLFANHLRAVEPIQFWQLVGAHTAAAMVPLLAICLLMSFRPPRPLITNASMMGVS